MSPAVDSQPDEVQAHLSSPLVSDKQESSRHSSRLRNFLRNWQRLSYISIPTCLPDIVTFHLCGRCRELEERLLRPQLPIISVHDHELAEFRYEHHDWDTLKQSSERGCRLCQVFRAGCLTHFRENSSDNRLETMKEVDSWIQSHASGPTLIDGRVIRRALRQRSDGRTHLETNNPTHRWDCSSISFRFLSFEKIAGFLIGNDEGKFVRYFFRETDRKPSFQGCANLIGHRKYLQLTNRGVHGQEM